MTADAKREQKAMLLLEHQEAEQELAHLVEAAKRLAGRFDEVSWWLKEQATGATGGVCVQRDRNLSSDSQLPLDLDYERVIAAIKQVKQARERVDDLSRRKLDLGLR